MIPEFIDIGGPWSVLPPGIHDASMKEAEHRFATNGERKRLFDGFRKGAASLRKAGCSAVFLDGSFVTAKPNPADFDACWDPTGVNVVRLDPVLLDFSEQRKKQRERYGGEFFPTRMRTGGSQTFIEFFRIDRHTGREKGIVRIVFADDAEEQENDDR